MSLKKETVSLKVNGKSVTKSVLEGRTLADFLQEDLDLTGTKVCCGLGICKACTVAIRATPNAPLAKMQSCIMPVKALANQEVTTIEGLSKDGKLSALQKSFLKHFSFQCGYSTSGFLMGATVLLDQLKRSPIKRSQVDQAIQEAVGENICRCTGYKRYFSAIKEVILQTKGLTKA